MLVRRRRTRWWLLFILASAGGACREAGAPGTAPESTAAAAPRRAPPPQPHQELAAAIERSAHFLAGLCDVQGRFRYRFHLDPAVELPPAYNELRHAGAVYALAQCQRRAPDPDVASAMLRGAAFLRRECLGPVADQPAVRLERRNWAVPG